MRSRVAALVQPASVRWLTAANGAKPGGDGVGLAVQDPRDGDHADGKNECGKGGAHRHLGGHEGRVRWFQQRPQRALEVRHLIEADGKNALRRVAPQQV